MCVDGVNGVRVPGGWHRNVDCVYVVCWTWAFVSDHVLCVDFTFSASCTRIVVVGALHCIHVVSTLW